jgi:ferredoxin
MGSPLVLDVDGFRALISALRAEGRVVLGPTLREGAVVYDRIESVEDLPIGWRDVQSPGNYRLERRHDQALFGYAVGPQSWKKVLYPSHEVLWRAERGAERLGLVAEDPEIRWMAFIGVRACELSALSVLDRVFVGAVTEPRYAGRRKECFIVAVNCTEPGGNCFCASMGTGPTARGGFDISLTEMVGGPSHWFLATAGSEAGRDLLARLPARPATLEEIETERTRMTQASETMGKHLDTHDLPALLIRNLEHPRWDQVAARCLACTNCTLVCPTCFCSTTEDSLTLDGATATRQRRWDSCFTLDFSYLVGHTVRSSVRSRYRQWMTHKLSTWHDQFGVSGCVGCGRCITWCPVGIDITEEAAAIREEERDGS